MSKRHTLSLPLILLLCMACTSLRSQDSSSLYNKIYQDTSAFQISEVPPEYFNKVSKRTGLISKDIEKKSAKVLRRYKKQEARILGKLMRVDSIAARNFKIVSEQRYKELQNNLAIPERLTRYIPKVDTLLSSLKFLKQLSSLGLKKKEIETAFQRVKGMSEKLQNGEDIKQYLKEQKQYMKEQLARFGLAKELRKINRDAYYYSEELLEIKSTLNDETKIERKAIEILSRTKVFQQFMQKNSMLSSLLRIPGQDGNSVSANIAASLAGLQTRTQVNQLIQGQIAAGGPNAQQVIQANLQQAQGQIRQLTNRINEFGSRGSDDIMPEGFTPNPERTKSFFKRLELNTNFQSQRSNNYFPVSTDLGIGLGYRVSPKAIVGIGASYKIGWGEKIQHIKITHQGIGLRSYLDWKIPSSFFGRRNGADTWWISGGYEQNYKSEIKKIDQLKNHSAWQASGLIGVSKKISITSRFLKGTKMQLLWDFLSYQHPATSPIVFRLGYTIK